MDEGMLSTVRIGDGPEMQVESWSMSPVRESEYADAIENARQWIIRSYRVPEDYLSWSLETAVRSAMERKDKWPGVQGQLLEAEMRKLIPSYMSGRKDWQKADYLAMSDLLEEKGLTLAADYFRRCGS